jgi:hypothetical protein
MALAVSSGLSKNLSGQWAGHSLQNAHLPTRKPSGWNSNRRRLWPTPGCNAMEEEVEDNTVTFTLYYSTFSPSFCTNLDANFDVLFIIIEFSIKHSRKSTSHPLRPWLGSRPEVGNHCVGGWLLAVLSLQMSSSQYGKVKTFGRSVTTVVFLWLGSTRDIWRAEPNFTWYRDRAL